MFRVPQDTVLRRVAVTTLLVFTTALSACGGDDKTEAAGNAGASPTKAETAPLESTPALEPASTDAAPGEGYDLKISAKKAKKFTDGLETEATIKKLKDDKLSVADVEKQIKTIEAEGRKEGFTPIITTPGENQSISSYNQGNHKILFFRSEREAGVGTRRWQQLINTHPGFARADRRGARTYLLINPKKYTPSEEKGHREMMKRFEKILASLQL